LAFSLVLLYFGMHLSRNFAWSLNLSDREFKVVMKKLRGEKLSVEEEGLAQKIVAAIESNAVRLERISSGRAFKGPRPPFGSSDEQKID
jgi:hypothetical protein